MASERIIAERYRLQQLLGEGSFGETWLAQDLLRNNESCAVKLLKSARSSLQKEFKLLQSLYHPHIVEVLAHGHDDISYLVSEFIEGKTFDQATRNLENKKLWKLIAQVCRALSYIHSKKVIHGDLKPDNILVETKTGTAKLIDFGLASLQKATKGEKAAGTLAYMAPEVIRNGTRSKKSDLYALGMILYQVLNKGRLPFTDQPELMIQYHLNEAPSFDFLAHHSWGPSLESILGKLLAKSPAQRPNDALEVLTLLNKQQGLRLEVHRGTESSADEAIFFQDIADYLNATEPLLQLSSVSSPHSFLASEAERIEKYLAVASQLSPKEAAQWIDRLHETQVRLFIQEGRYRDALKVKGKSDLIQNVHALALIYLEEFSRAEKQLQKIRTQSKDKLQRARAANYLGMAAYNQGELDAARPHFETSLREMKAVDDSAGIISNAMNLAGIAQQQGQISEALKSYRQALASARDLKNSYLLAILLSNMANLFVQVGSLDEAEDYLEQSQQLAKELGLHLVSGYNLLLESDCAAWRDDSNRTDDLLEQALDAFSTNKQMFSLCAVKYAEAAFRSHQWGPLAARLKNATTAIQKASTADLKFRLEILKLQLQMVQTPAPRKLPAILDKLAASDSKQRFHIASVRALWALQQRNSEAAQQALEAMQTAYDEDLESLPVAYRAQMAQAPLYKILWELQEQSKRLHQAPADRSLWHLIEINKRMAAQRETQSLYDMILDAALELTGGERGFLITPVANHRKKATWNVQASRQFRKRELPGGSDRLSQNIINRLLKNQKPLLVQNALEESKLAKFQSVQDLKLRSILAVPIITHGKVNGALYVDHSQTANLFENKDLELLKAFSDQAGLAMTNAQLYEEALEKQKQVEAARAQLEKLNEQLEEDLEDTSEWAEHLEEQLKQSVAAGKVVARSVSMKHIVSRLPAFAASRKPVLLSGEVGTGKKLLTRVLHHQSEGTAIIHQVARQLPRWRTGTEEVGVLAHAFERAHSGTLFVEGLEELPVPYQRELLAFINSQKLNKERDVFIILASRNDLKGNLNKGLILPELREALTGCEIRIPPLRKRKEDISPLAKHFLERLAQERGLERKINRRALSILQQYSWPGNARELQIEMERAALSSQLTIGPLELSPNLLQEAGYVPGAPKKADTDLQDKRADFERDIVLQALEKTGWNKARAAKELGLSRAMLYIKLKKYQIPLQ